jgi:putative PEP-CTERM system histidine kinase
MLAFLRTRQWVIDLPEWRASPDAYDDLRLPADLADDPDNWLIVPLMLHDDLLGFVVLNRPLTAPKIDWEVRDALKAAARQVSSYLAVRRAVEALVTARQFESFNRMSAFVVHDLKNLVAQLTLLTTNAAKHRHNPEFQDDMLETVQNVLARMQGLLMQLRLGTKPIEKPSRVRVAPIIQAAVRSKKGLRPEPQVTIAAELEGATVRAHADRLERVIGHLVQNAAEATPQDGRIGVRLRREGEQAVIEIEDNGKGMSERFIRESLFRPFASTKEHGMGIGTFESRDYIRELGGALEVASREQVGTTFRIRLPLQSSTHAPDRAPADPIAAADGPTRTAPQATADASPPTAPRAPAGAADE